MTSLWQIKSERAAQMEHTRERLRERFDICAADETVEELTRAALLIGLPITWPSAEQLTKLDRFRHCWYRVRFRDRDMAVCVDKETLMARTVIPARD